MSKNNSLYQEMKQFQQEKKGYFIALICLGILGTVIPVIPGLFLIGLGIALVSPRNGELLLSKIKTWFRSLIKV